MNIPKNDRKITRKIMIFRLTSPPPPDKFEGGAGTHLSKKCVQKPAIHIHSILHDRSVLFIRAIASRGGPVKNGKTLPGLQSCKKIEISNFIEATQFSPIDVARLGRKQALPAQNRFASYKPLCFEFHGSPRG